MRKPVSLLAFVLVATLMVAGTAVAITMKQCGGGECQGTTDPELLYGTGVEDTVYGRGGGDRIYGYGDDDRLKGGPGADGIYGGSGDNRMKAGSGADEVYGGAGDEILRGSTIEQTDDGVRDILDCGGGLDTVYFVPGQDQVADNCEIKNPSTF